VYLLVRHLPGPSGHGDCEGRPAIAPFRELVSGREGGRVGDNADVVDGVLRVHVAGRFGHSRAISVTTTGALPCRSSSEGRGKTVTGRWKKPAKAARSRALNAAMYRS